MASELTVQTIRGPVSGANANKILLADGQTFDARSGFMPPSGHVIQIVQGNNSTYYGSSSTGVWITTHSFSINNVKSGSSLFIDYSPAGLMEHAGAVLYSVFDADGNEIGRSAHNGSGNGGWRTAPTTIMCKDPSPVAGTNTYTLRMYTTGPYMYLNYQYPTGFNMVSHYKITEVA